LVSERVSEWMTEQKQVRTTESNNSASIHRLRLLHTPRIYERNIIKGSAAILHDIYIIHIL
jgi:hypothetical protein